MSLEQEDSNLIFLSKPILMKGCCLKQDKLYDVVSSLAFPQENFRNRLPKYLSGLVLR